MKKTNSIILFLSLLFVSINFCSCGGSKSSNNNFVFEKNPPFKIEESYFQKWTSGVEEGGSGINVHILFSEMEPNMAIQNIYFRNHILEAKSSPNDPNNFTAHLKKDSDKRSFVMDSDPLKEAQNTPSEEFPFHLDENEAVISYWFEGKRNYYKVHNLSEKREIAYPQAPPHK